MVAIFVVAFVLEQFLHITFTESISVRVDKYFCCHTSCYGDYGARENMISSHVCLMGGVSDGIMYGPQGNLSADLFPGS